MPDLMTNIRLHDHRKKMELADSIEWKLREERYSLDGWEEQFLKDVMGILRKGGDLSDKQDFRLRTILAKGD